MAYYVYILRCGNGTLYTGSTNDVPRRLAIHQSGKGAKYTRSRLPVALAYWEELGDYATAGIVFIGALLAYLWQNAKPSTLLMGDAGSRAMGFFLAVLALKSSHPFAFLLAALVFIVDGSLGILKISFKRFLHISILRNTLTPLHDHVRKRLGWSDEQVVARWLILQAVASALLLLMVR